MWKKLLAVPDLSKLSRRERLLAAGSVLVVSVVLLDRLVLGPWWQHTQQIRREIGKLEESIRSARQLIARKPVVSHEVELYHDYLQKVEEGAPDMASMLREIEALGKESGVSLGEVKPLAAPADEPSQGQTLEVRYTGSLDQWIHFLHLLESSTSLFEIKRSTVARTEDQSGVLEGLLQLTSKTRRRPPPTEGNPS